MSSGTYAARSIGSANRQNFMLVKGLEGDPRYKAFLRKMNLRE
jgi:hypothetical protein